MTDLDAFRRLMLALVFAMSVDARAFAGEAPRENRTGEEWAKIASQHLKEGDRPKAIEALRAAVKADPAHGAAGMLISTLHQAGQVEEAYALGERYHRAGPRNPRALFRYGWVLAFLGEVDRAEVVFRDLIELDRDGVYAAWGNGELAYLARARGDFDGAVAFMERAVAARPDDMISRVGRAQMMVEAGKARAAVPLLEAELAADPAARGYGAMPAALVLGWALRLLGDDAAANRWLDPLEASLFPAVPDPVVRQLGMEPMHAARQLAYHAVRGRREAALQLAERIASLPLYGAPDPHDGMFKSLVGEPRYTALLARSIDRIDAERARLGLRPMTRTTAP